MRNQLKSGIILSYISTAITIIIQLIYMPMMIRILGQHEYGVYSLVSSVVSYLSLFSLGFTGAYLRFFSRYNYQNDKEGLASLNGMFISMFLILSLMALVCGSLLSCYPKQIFGNRLTQNELKTARTLMIILVIGVAISLVNSIFESIVAAYEQFVFQKIVLLLASLMNPFICLPLLLKGYGSVILVLVSTGITIYRLVMNIWFCLYKIKIPISFVGFQWKVLKEIVVFSAFLLLNMIIDQINWNVDKLILSHTNGASEVAIYGVASQVNGIFITFSTTISSVFSPKVNRIAIEFKDNYQKLFTLLMSKIGRIQWIIVGLCATGFIIFGKYFILNIYAGKEYETAYYTALYLILPSLISLIQDVAIEMQRSLNKHKFRSIVYLLMMIINICISIPLAIRFGSVGTAMGTTVSLVLGNGIILNIYYHKILKINMIYFWKEIFKTLKGFIIPSILAIYIMNYVRFDTIIKYFYWIVIYLIIYCVSMFILGCNKEERNLVIGLKK